MAANNRLRPFVSRLIGGFIHCCERMFEVLFVNWSMERELDPTLKAIIEFRGEVREFRTETRATLVQHTHQLNLIGVTIGSLKTDVGALLKSVPIQNERLDELEARMGPLETSGSP